MTYEELLDKWIRKLGRPCTAGEIVHDLRQLEIPEVTANAGPTIKKDCLYYEESKDMGATVHWCKSYREIIATCSWCDEYVHKDLVPVVRCKDCRWWAKDEIMHDTTQRRCTEHECYFEPDDFCSWGERREDG